MKLVRDLILDLFSVQNQANLLTPTVSSPSSAASFGFVDDGCIDPP